MSLLTTSNVSNFVQCLLELIANSLNANSTAIAVRIDPEKRKIQVVDNGDGISEDYLKGMAEYESSKEHDYYNARKIDQNEKFKLTNVRRLSDAMAITSRCRNSERTYTKIFEAYQKSNTIEVPRRPSSGTTVTVYGFYQLTPRPTWNVPLAYFVIANLALNNPRTSFSIRDDRQGRVIMSIAKSRSQTEILNLLYNKEISLRYVWRVRSAENSNTEFLGYIGLSRGNSKATQVIYLNNRLVRCPVLLQLISSDFVNITRYHGRGYRTRTLEKEAVFILLFLKSTEFLVFIENGRETLVPLRIQSLLQNIRSRIADIFTTRSTSLSDEIRGRYLNKIGVSSRQESERFYNGRLDAETIEKNRSIDRWLSDLRKNSISVRDTDNVRNIPKWPFGPITSIRKNDKQNRLFRLTKRKITKLKISTERYTEKTFNDSNNSFPLYTAGPLAFSINGSADRENVDTNKSNDNDTSKAGTSSVPEKSFHENMALSALADQRNRNDAVDNDYAQTISEWSDWIYDDKDSDEKRKENRRFDVEKNRFEFLPCKLRKLLRFANTKVTKVDSTIGSVENLPHQEMEVRPCKYDKQFYEFKLQKELLKYVEILGQINGQLIAGLLTRDNTKILLLMDQHAIHERIRYEDLLAKYKLRDRKELVSVKLREPVVLQLSTENSNMLLSKKSLLKRFGIDVRCARDNAVSIRSVPECLKRNPYYYDQPKIKAKLEQLLNEISESLTTNRSSYRINDLPPTIHDAIATEACHGAIKFGDSLTRKECNWLMSLLLTTKIPTRCAHGRPSIIPLLDLAEFGRKHRIPQVCP